MEMLRKFKFPSTFYRDGVVLGGKWHISCNNESESNFSKMGDNSSEEHISLCFLRRASDCVLD